MKPIEFDGLVWKTILNGYPARIIKEGGKNVAVLLHRYVWEKKNGKIKKGHHIHHIDGDKMHYSIENLVELSPSTHATVHCPQKRKVNEHPLAVFRNEMGVSQEWLAERMKLTTVTISRYEMGITEPPYSFWFLLADIFRFTPKELSKRIGEFELG